VCVGWLGQYRVRVTVLRVRVRVRVRVGDRVRARARAVRCAPLVASIAAMSSGSAHMPLPGSG
jgi:hypothetical protein